MLKEKNLPYELIPVNLAEKANTTAEYLAKQPFGQIPVLDDNGYIIYGERVCINSSQVRFNTDYFFFPPLESRAIGRYIALKYANQGTQGLIPDGSDFEATGRFEEACSLEYSQFNPSAEGLGQELIFKKYGLLNFLLQAIKIHHVLQLGSGVEKQIPLPSRNTLPHLRRNWMPTRKS